jgi:AraC-like DNA-binding protein
MEFNDNAYLWEPKALNGISLFKAQFKRFAFSKHTHEAFAIGVIEQGVQQFYHKGTTYTAPQGTILTINPEEVHDGRTATPYGYQYRMAYIQPKMIAEILTAFFGARSETMYFDCPVTIDVQLSVRLKRCLQNWEQPNAVQLEEQSELIQILEMLFQRHAKPHQLAKRSLKNDRAVRLAIAYINAQAEKDISLEDIAAVAQISRFHLLRVFKATTGLPPHAYLVQRRLELARKAIEQGVPLIDAAIASGFADQSHLTRIFKKAFGVTPGQFQQLQII